MAASRGIGPAAALVAAFVIEALPSVGSAQTHTSTVGPRLELGVLPALNFNSDIGVGFGVIGVLTQVAPDADPYRWRLSLQVLAAVKEDAGGVEVPYQNHEIDIDVPGLLIPDLRLNAQLAFRRFSNAAYYGFGNRTAPADLGDDTEEARRFDRYDRVYPSFVANGRFMLYRRPRREGRRRLEVFAGLGLTYNIIDVYAQSRLQADLARLRDPEAPVEDRRTLEALLLGVEDHALVIFNLGLLWDSRDHEYEPSRGLFSELSSRWSPGVQDGLRYAGFFWGASGYTPVFTPRLILAGRFAADLLVGDVPLYALSQYGALNPGDGPGGAASTRGVLLQRYIGKIKLIGNLELRGHVLQTSLFKQVLRFGLSAFFDAGRVWADYLPRRLDGRRLDGPFPELRTGVGGGLHFRWGEAFVVRGQFGYSPSDATTGLYVDVNHAF